ncbi:hypothetical protein FIE12Z_10999 [Fusarium flagelliforme]|uniref:Uncharacterized protein n=1 Tax=Fusarium flagelliforme TaxID=2675880 RepID=A0A395MBR5_9HYPO|nr:hypothetical protein FIE12Z_10999 [Fusarium flagelliforme]
MQLSKHIVAVISAVSIAATGNAAPGPGEVGEFWSIECKHGEPNNIVSSDIKNMASHLATQTTFAGVKSPYTLPENGAFSWYWGTAAMEVLNKYLFEKATVEYHHLAGALEAMRNQCCGSYPTCIGSVAYMRSSNYKNVVVIIRKS